MPTQVPTRSRARAERAPQAPQPSAAESLYKHILVPVDGSRLSQEAAAEAVKLAKLMGARITAFHVVPEVPSIELEAWARHDQKYLEHLQESFERQSKAYVARVKALADEAGVACAQHYARAVSPAAEIVLAAKERRCDLIVMGSHGMGEAADPLLGSVTAKVLALGSIPVLVHRSSKAATG